jgi:hypothetical protein
VVVVDRSGRNARSRTITRRTVHTWLRYVIDVDSGAARQIDVFGEVDKGWVPPNEVWEQFELLGKPHFTSTDAILLEPYFGEPSRLVLAE